MENFGFETKTLQDFYARLKMTVCCKLGLGLVSHFIQELNKAVVF